MVLDEVVPLEGPVRSLEQLILGTIPVKTGTARLTGLWRQFPPRLCYARPEQGFGLGGICILPVTDPVVTGVEPIGVEGRGFCAVRWLLVDGPCSQDVESQRAREYADY
jgi:hypothetical protein